jgi:hypothetical protein
LFSIKSLSVAVPHSGVRDKRSPVARLGFD